jgi:Phosphotransferase enzyme family
MTLAEAVSRAVGQPVVSIHDVGREPLAYDPFLAGRAVARLRGVAVTARGRVEWSMVEKSTEGPAVASEYLRDNALRELRAYESGLLDDLASTVAAPHAYSVAHGPEGALTLWLEDLSATAAGVNGAELPNVAFDLGQLAGRWVDRAPDHPWLFRGWLDRHGQPEAVKPALERLRALRSREDIERRVGWTIDQAIALIAQQGVYRSVLGDLPETLCHHDAVAANVFRRAGGQEPQTLLIDWESVGPGPVGADLASLLFSSVRRGDISAATFRSVAKAALAAYTRGLHDAGARLERTQVRLGVHAAIALRWTLARDVVLAIADRAPVFRGSAPGESSSKSLAELIALSRQLFGSARIVASGIPRRSPVVRDA